MSRSPSRASELAGRRRLRSQGRHLRPRTAAATAAPPLRAVRRCTTHFCPDAPRAQPRGRRAGGALRHRHHRGDPAQGAHAQGAAVEHAQPRRRAPLRGEHRRRHQGARVLRRPLQRVVRRQGHQDRRRAAGLHGQVLGWRRDGQRGARGPPLAGHPQVARLAPLLRLRHGRLRLPRSRTASRTIARPRSTTRTTTRCGHSRASSTRRSRRSS